MITYVLATSQDWGEGLIGHLWNILRWWLKCRVPGHPQSRSWNWRPGICINFNKLPGLLFCSLKFDRPAVAPRKPRLRTGGEGSCVKNYFRLISFQRGFKVERWSLEVGNSVYSLGFSKSSRAYSRHSWAFFLSFFHCLVLTSLFLFATYSS